MKHWPREVTRYTQQQTWLLDINGFSQRIIGVLKTAKEFKMRGWIAKQAAAGAAGMTMLMQEWRVVMIVEVASTD